MYCGGVNRIDLSDKLTDRLYQDTNSQKLHKQIVELLIESTITNDYVKQYYTYMS